MKGRYKLHRKDPIKHPTRYSKSDAVKLLEGMADADARRRMPTVPHLARRIFRDDTASGLTKCIITFLNLSGHQGLLLCRSLVLLLLCNTT